MGRRARGGSKPHEAEPGTGVSPHHQGAHFDALATFVVLALSRPIRALYTARNVYQCIHKEEYYIQPERTTENSPELREITRTLLGTATAGGRDGERAGGVMSARREGAR